MNQIITQKLDEIESSENVKIIFAVESGSRAWGFASPDSDYDVRFIYVRPKDYYLRIEKTRDVIEWQLDNVLDINGWDIKKALQLLYKSNPTLFEWCNSPIVYKTTPLFSGFQELIKKYFSVKPSIYHYLNIARNTYHDQLTEETVKYKKYFYALRPILACKWILEIHTAPPILFSDLVESQMDNELKPLIENLLEIKVNTPELGAGKKIDELNIYIEKNIMELTDIMQKTESESEQNLDELNHYFLSVLS